jgi:hypothetical protein|tara:strand:- start:141 stop:338 length:198 start_codon:yes stop_codon:yes gene_type:complete
MPDLRIQTAIDNGDLSKDHGQSFKDITLEQAIDPTVIKAYYEQFKKEFGRPSIFASPTKGSRSES